MASMRVHELAKEFDMTSKDLLDRAARDEDPGEEPCEHARRRLRGDKIRKNLEPEIKQRAGKLEDEEAAKLAARAARSRGQKQAEEERARREAVEKERAPARGGARPPRRRRSAEGEEGTAPAEQRRPGEGLSALVGVPEPGEPDRE